MPSRIASKNRSSAFRWPRKAAPEYMNIFLCPPSSSALKPSTRKSWGPKHPGLKTPRLQAAEMSGAVPVLLYHHISPDREITPEEFDAQLACLRNQGRRSLSLAEFQEHMSGRPAPEGSVLITFDDGYLDNWVYAFPLLRRHGMKAVFFIVTDRILSGER